jgi:hypothetical protein
MTQPLADVTLIVIPPARAARQVISRRCVVARTRTPATATRTRVGANFNSTRTKLLRGTVAVRVEAEIGAPQCAAQHHDEIASGTRLFAPLSTYATGGYAAPSTNATRATTPGG